MGERLARPGMRPCTAPRQLVGVAVSGDQRRRASLPPALVADVVDVQPAIHRVWKQLRDLLKQAVVAADAA